eukprot:gene1303-953_t
MASTAAATLDRAAPPLQSPHGKVSFHATVAELLSASQSVSEESRSAMLEQSRSARQERLQVVDHIVSRVLAHAESEASRLRHRAQQSLYALPPPRQSPHNHSDSGDVLLARAWRAQASTLWAPTLPSRGGARRTTSAAAAARATSAAARATSAAAASGSDEGAAAAATHSSIESSVGDPFGEHKHRNTPSLLYFVSPLDSLSRRVVLDGNADVPRATLPYRDTEMQDLGRLTEKKQRREIGQHRVEHNQLIDRMKDKLEGQEGIQHVKAVEERSEAIHAAKRFGRAIAQDITVMKELATTLSRRATKKVAQLVAQWNAQHEDGLQQLTEHVQQLADGDFLRPVLQRRRRDQLWCLDLQQMDYLVRRLSPDDLVLASGVADMAPRQATTAQRLSRRARPIGATAAAAAARGARDDDSDRPSDEDAEDDSDEADDFFPALGGQPPPAAQQPRATAASAAAAASKKTASSSSPSQPTPSAASGGGGGGATFLTQRRLSQSSTASTASRPSSSATAAGSVVGAAPSLLTSSNLAALQQQQAPQPSLPLLIDTGDRGAASPATRRDRQRREELQQQAQDEQRRRQLRVKRMHRDLLRKHRHWRHDFQHCYAYASLLESRLLRNQEEFELLGRQRVRKKVWFVNLLRKIQRLKRSAASAKAVPSSLFLLLATLRKLIVLDVSLSRDVVWTLVDETVSAEEYGSNLVYSALQLVFDSVGISAEEVYKRLKARLQLSAASPSRTAGGGHQQQIHLAPKLLATVRKERKMKQLRRRIARQQERRARHRQRKRLRLLQQQLRYRGYCSPSPCERSDSDGASPAHTWRRANVNISIARSARLVWACSSR